MKNHSLYNFFVKEICKKPINRINLQSFIKVIRSKAQNASIFQFFYVHRQINRLYHYIDQKSFGKQISPSNQKASKVQSYQKNAVICLQEAIKLKEQDFEQGVDLCKLSYLRLLNVINYQLPYLNVLEEFRQEFLSKDLDYQVIDYAALIGKDPRNLSGIFLETVNLVIQIISEELENIDILQLPYLKRVLSKAISYGIYTIQHDLISRLDVLINQNKYAYSFWELEACLNSDHKNIFVLQYFSLLMKDPIDKKLNYLYLQAQNQSINPIRSSKVSQNQSQLPLPGVQITEELRFAALKKMSYFQLYGVYINLFPKQNQTQQITTVACLRQYLNYHHKYFQKSGNVGCNSVEIIHILQRTLSDEVKLKQKGMSFSQTQILALFFVIQMLMRKPITGQQIRNSHALLQKQLHIFNSVQKTRIQQAQKIFSNSTDAFDIQTSRFDIVKTLLEAFSKFVSNTSENNLSNHLRQELEFRCQNQKQFLLNQLIICLIFGLKSSAISQYTKNIGKLLETFMKIEFKKFSVEASKIQKILDLIKQNSNEKQIHSMSEQTKNSLFQIEKNSSYFKEVHLFVITLQFQRVKFTIVLLQLQIGLSWIFQPESSILINKITLLITKIFSIDSRIKQNMYRVFFKVIKISIHIKEALLIEILFKKGNEKIVGKEIYPLLEGKCNVNTTTEFLISKVNPSFELHVNFTFEKVKRQAGYININLSNLLEGGSYQEVRHLQKAPAGKAFIEFGFIFFDSGVEALPKSLQSFEVFEKEMTKQYRQQMQKQINKFTRNIDELINEKESLTNQKHFYCKTEEEFPKKEAELEEQVISKYKKLNETSNLVKEQKQKETFLIDLVNNFGSQDLIQQVKRLNESERMEFEAV